MAFSLFIAPKSESLSFRAWKKLGHYLQQLDQIDTYSTHIKIKMQGTSHIFLFEILLKG